MTAICLKSELDPEYPTKVTKRDGSVIAIYLVEDKVYATDDRCSHGEASLADGYLEGYNVVCPFHMGSFDVRSGKATKAPCFVAIKTHKTRVEGDRVYLCDDD